ncbi:MAG: diacylglycerol/lipid kinase family protein [Armatimonadota bacterium]
MPELLESSCNLERVAVIFNPASGTETLETRRARVESLARAAGLPCELQETEELAGAAPLAEAALRDRMERVIVCGGDGSVMEAAGVVAGTDAALAVIPGGTGNLLAVNLGLPTDAEEAMRLALTGPVRRIDVGRANGHAFLIMAGMGADARMIRDADRELKSRFGPLAYFIAAWKNRRRARAEYRITIDGRSVRRHAQTVLVANLGRITGGVELVPGADPADGLLEVAILRARTPRELALMALDALLGRPQRRDFLEVYRGREITIETELPQPVQVDGNEVESTTRLEVRVEPGSLGLVGHPAGSEPAHGLLDPAEVARQLPPVTLALLAGGAAAGAAHLAGRSRRRSRAVPLAAGLVVGIATYLVARAAVDAESRRSSGGR